MKIFISILVFFLCSTANSIESFWSSGAESQLRLISPYTNIDSKSRLYIGLEYKLNEGWKTYWKSPGDGGFPQNINWDLSKNIEDIEILWPAPSEFEVLGLNTIGYQNQVIFPIKLDILDISKEAKINLDVNYLVCKDICIPGNAKLNLIIPPGNAKITKYFFDIEKSLSQIPNKALDISDIQEVITTAYGDDSDVSINIKIKNFKQFINPKFYLDTEFGLPVRKPILKYSANFKEVEANFLFKKELINKEKFLLTFLLVDNDLSFEFSDNIEIKEASSLSIKLTSFMYFFLIAFIGGFILNLMPCVLPVLSIKLLSILNVTNDRKLIRRSFLMTALGIESSFLILALLSILLKIMGINIGWGMQFQQPIFLILIGIILFIFMMNIFNFFEFQVPSFMNNNSFFNRDVNSNFKDFFNGLFATILATPCSAPFVGTAITLAFTQSYLILLGIFVSMGLGMSFPYILISFFPRLISFFPKPGYWMEILKFILGFMLLGTLFWIGFLLLNHFNYLFIIISIMILIIFLFTIKFLKKSKIIVGTTLLISLFIIPFYFDFDYESKLDISKWEDFNLSEINEFIRQDKIIFVDITADWCITCQYNKINVINSKEIKDIFLENDIKLFKGDWTKPNKDIENFLKSYNKFGIPFNIIYSKSYPKGIILSELLTNNEIIKNIELIKLD